MIAGIFAVDEGGAIGCDGALPWKHNKDDMHWFQHATLSTCVFMGRNTWESLPQKPLPKRKNIVVSSKYLSARDRCLFADFERRVHEEHEKTDVFIIGGAQLLLAARHLLTNIFISRIPGVHVGDTFIDIVEFVQGFELRNLRNLERCTIEEYQRSFT